MRSKVLAFFGAMFGALLSAFPAFATSTPVGTMLSGIDTTTIQSEVSTFGVAAIGVTLVIAAIFLGKKLLRTMFT